MSLDDKIQGTNGTETRNLEASELDPCMEDTKDGRKSDFFHRYRDRACEKSGLSHKGLYIVGGVVILAALLFIVVIALAAAWPRIPHRYQFPVCQDAECLEAAAQIQEGLNSSISPCDDLWQATCGGWLKKYPLPKDRGVWNQKQQLVRRESERVRDLIATLELPVHSGTVEWKLKHLYEACLDVDNVNTDDARPLLDIISELGKSLKLSVLVTLELIPFIVAISHGKPGGSYSYPAPTQTASVAPQVFLPSPDETPAPPVINLSAPTIAPPLLVENVIGAGQYGSPLVNVGAQPLGLQPFGLQSLGFQPFGFQSLGDQSLNLNFGLPLANQGLNLEQSGFNLGGSLLPISLPQLSLGSSQLPLGLPQVSVTPATDLSLSSSQLSVGSVGPTIATSSVAVQGPSVQTGAVEVQKHVYVHVAPEEPEAKLPPRQIIIPPPRKHYKIIFIKAPSPPAPVAPVIPPRAQDEEKTLVYVLVKKPEEQPEIKFHAAPPTRPTKPEVYFVRYNTRKESFAGGSIPSVPLPIPGRIGSDATVPTVRFGADTSVNLDLNKASLNGGSPLPIEGGTGSVSIVEDVVKGSDVTVPTVTIGDSGLHTSVDLNLNKASLTGGSALSLSVTGTPVEQTLHVSSTPPPPPKYGPQEQK